MKQLLYVLIPAAIMGACSTSDTARQNPDHDTATEEITGDQYGPQEVNTADVISVADMVKKQGDSDKKATYTFEGTITEVCSKAGCWVSVDDGNGGSFRVRFKDHFTIPTDTEPGTKAIFHGEAFQDEVSVDMLKHFAEDAGKSQEEMEKITEPRKELGFTADGILLVKEEGK